jgi:hypothetical protein
MLTKKEKYYNYVYKEFYKEVSEHYFRHNAHTELNTPFEFLTHFSEGFMWYYYEGMYNMLDWTYEFTHKYYNGFLSDEGQYKITMKLFEDLYMEFSSLCSENPSNVGGYGCPYSEWLNENYSHFNVEFYE